MGERQTCGQIPSGTAWLCIGMRWFPLTECRVIIAIIETNAVMRNSSVSFYHFFLVVFAVKVKKRGEFGTIM